MTKRLGKASQQIGIKHGMELAFASANKETFMKNDLGSSFRDESQVEVKKKVQKGKKNVVQVTDFIICTVYLLKDFVQQSLSP